MRFARALCAAAAVALIAPGAALAQWHDVPNAGFRALTLDDAALRADLAGAPKLALKARAAAMDSGTVLALPAPDGGVERFTVVEAPVMEPGLAARHPEIKTYAGRGLDDPTASLRADTTPLGFHASVRSTHGDWYIDPYRDNVYVSYYGRELENPHGKFGFDDIDGTSEPPPPAAAAAEPTVQLRTYRLALASDPSYAAYFGGQTTAAKVTLVNRVDQIYEAEQAVRLILIADNDKLNLDTPAQMTGANGPCGAAPCYTAAQASTCGSATLERNRIVIGQLAGAGRYDVGHLALGLTGGGLATVGVAGGDQKAQGCTGLSTPVGDFFAVDYVAHELDHQFGANHTFDGTSDRCSGGNRNAATSVEPGSGSSIMAYAGICGQDDLQRHSDPYLSQRTRDEVAAFVTAAQPAISEVQTVSLRDFGGVDALTLAYGARVSAPIVRGAGYTTAGIQQALQGVAEVQTVSPGADTYSLVYQGATSMPIVRGQNDTPAGITTAIQGGNEQQQVTLTNFNAFVQSFQIRFGTGTTLPFGANGLALTNSNIASAVNALFPGTVVSTGAGNSGFTLTFTGASAATDMPSIAIVNCTCTSAVREIAKGGAGLATWPAGATVAVGPVSDAGFTLTFGGSLLGTDVDPFSVTPGTVTETARGAPGILPPGASAAVAAFGGTGALDDTGFQVTFGGTLANVDVPALTVVVSGGSGFVGETAQGGPVANQGLTVTESGNHPPVVSTPAAFTIPLRTPFALTGGATDADGDPLTFMWEQNDRGGPGGMRLFNNTRTMGPLFRQFGTASTISENATSTDPTRVLPDRAQILAGKTNARTAACPDGDRDCFSEFLPTADWIGFLGDRTLNFRLTARDNRLGGGGVGWADTKLVLAPLSGPFLVTSHAVPQTLFSGTPQTITWDVAGTASPPVNAAQVKISLASDDGATYVLAAVTANDGAERVVLPAHVAADRARIKVEALGNVFFDVSDADLRIVPAPEVTVGGSVPATLALTLGAPASFGTFVPGVAKEYTAQTTANVVSSAGDAALTVSEPGHLTNGAFALPQPLRVELEPASWDGPVSNAPVTIRFRQAIGAGDALRTGTYSRALTFTLATTRP
jgi:hypothetical protein